MLKLDLARLECERSVRVQGEVPATDPLWEGTGFSFETHLSVDLRAQQTGSGEVVVRGQVSGSLLQECRRCLEPVRTDLAEALTLVFVPWDLRSEEGDDHVRLIPHTSPVLGLDEAVREELVLAVRPYVVCDSDCSGLCPRCGGNLNEQTCNCVSEESDPRWDVLRTLKSD